MTCHLSFASCMILISSITLPQGSLQPGGSERRNARWSLINTKPKFEAGTVISAIFPDQEQSPSSTIMKHVWPFLHHLSWKSDLSFDLQLRIIILAFNIAVLHFSVSTYMCQFSVFINSACHNLRLHFLYTPRACEEGVIQSLTGWIQYFTSAVRVLTLWDNSVRIYMDFDRGNNTNFLYSKFIYRDSHQRCDVTSLV